MNKKEFIEELKKQTGLSEEKCIIINDVLENNFLIGKKNKDKIIIELKDKLQINEEEANEIYNTTSQIFASEIKEKIKHPFKSKD